MHSDHALHLLTCLSVAGVVGMGPAVESSATLTAMVTAGALTAAVGLHQMLRPAPAPR